MDQHWHSATVKPPAPTAPGVPTPGAPVATPTRRDGLERGAADVEAWLQVQDPDEDSELDRDAEDLWQIHALALAQAPAAQVALAVRRARRSGWAWAPIALLLGLSVPQARARFDRIGSGRPGSSRRSRWGRGASVRLPELIPGPRTGDETGADLGGSPSARCW